MGRPLDKIGDKVSGAKMRETEVRGAEQHEKAKKMREAKQEQ